MQSTLILARSAMVPRREVFETQTEVRTSTPSQWIAVFTSLKFT